MNDYKQLSDNIHMYVCIYKCANIIASTYALVVPEIIHDLPLKQDVSCRPDDSQCRLKVCLDFRKHIILHMH